MFTNLRQTDAQVFDAVRSEINRQAQGLELIASENFVSNAVLETMGTPLTNKYAEGYPKNRYYGGCEFHDVVEILAIQRARKLFGVEHANVQPHSGAQANMAVYFGCLEPGDTMMAMDLAHGGHLSHGSPVNSSGRLYNVVHYRVDAETHRIDFDHVRQMAQEHKPRLIVCGASAYPRFVEFEKFREIADEIGAKVMADIAHIAGLVVARIHPDPVPYCDFITTTTHKTLRGPRGGLILTSKENKRLVNSNLFPGTQGGPLMHMIAAKAVAFQEALQPSFAEYQKKVVENARALAEALLSQDIPLVSGGTDNHLMMMNVGALGLTGKQCEKALDEAGITVNKNMIPYDPNPPQVASGIRVGTPALTTRGMGADEMRTIAGWIRQVFDHVDDDKAKERVRAEVNQLTEQFPLYQDLLSQMKDTPA